MNFLRRKWSFILTLGYHVSNVTVGGKKIQYWPDYLQCHSSPVPSTIIQRKEGRGEGDWEKGQNNVSSEEQGQVSQVFPGNHCRPWEPSLEHPHQSCQYCSCAPHTPHRSQWWSPCQKIKCCRYRTAICDFIHCGSLGKTFQLTA